MIKSQQDENIFWLPEGYYFQYKTQSQGWYYLDKWGFAKGPYYTENQANDEYSKEIRG